jgi:hypothetical protein
MLISSDADRSAIALLSWVFLSIVLLCISCEGVIKNRDESMDNPNTAIKKRFIVINLNIRNLYF